MPVPFRLYLISDRTRMGPDPAGLIAGLAPSRPVGLQWREKDLSPAENLRRLEEIRAGLGPALSPTAPAGSAETASGVHLFVNDRVDLALAAGCHLHLTESSIPTDVARRLARPGMWIGRSTHSLAAARAAAAAGADFVTFGPVYETPSKRVYGPPAGLAALRAVCSVCAADALPVFALGGVTLERIEECLEAGAFGVAMIRAIWDASDPGRAIESALRRLDLADPRRP